MTVRPWIEGLRRAAETAHPALILGVTTTGLAFARSLGKRGVPVFLLDSPPLSPGMRTRYGTPVVMPDVVEHAEEWRAALIDAGAELAHAAVLIGAGDPHVLFLAEHREALSANFRFAIPSGDTVAMLCDKQRQYRWAQAHGVATPRTLFPRDASELDAMADDGLEFPCILKPHASHLWQHTGSQAKLIEVRNPAALRRAWTLVAPGGGGALVQEVIPGGDQQLHGFLGYCGGDSRVLAAFTKQKLRQHPPRYGNGSLQVSTDNREVERQSDSILQELSYVGLVGIEYKLDPRDDTYKLVEINPRAVSGSQLPIDAGVDLPWIYYRDVIGEAVEPVRSYRVGLVFANLGWDVQAYAAYRREKELSLLAWLRSLASVRSFAVLSLRDPRPFLSYVAKGVRMWWGRLFPTRR